MAIIDMPLLDTRNGEDLIRTFIADLCTANISFVAPKRETSENGKPRHCRKKQRCTFRDYTKANRTTLIKS